MWNIFEYPFVGLGIAVLAMIALWLLWIFKPEKKRKWHPLIPFIIIVLSFAVEYFVQTDREKILGAIDKGIRAFENQKIELIKEIISDDYSDSHHASKESLTAHCHVLFETAAIEKVTFLSREMLIEDNRATFTAEMFVKFAEESEIAKIGKAFLIVKARFHFIKTPTKRWLINNSESLELDRKQITWGEVNKI